MKKVIFYPINLIYFVLFLFRLALPPKSDTREELTALKALDKLLRTYDRRSTPTNDLGNYTLKLMGNDIETIRSMGFDY